MFFELAKVLGFLTTPSNFLIALAIAGVVAMMTRFAPAGRRIVVTSVLLLAVLGLSPLGKALILPLEHRFPPWTHSGSAPHGIIVLGGALAPEMSAARGTAVIDEAAERLTEIAHLARRYPEARIVYSGGSGSLIWGNALEADLAVPVLESFGIARDRIIVENRSRNTFENAEFSKALVNPLPDQRWLVVTSAHHMPRSVGAFRAVGFPVEPYPVDWRTRGSGDVAEPFPTVSTGLKLTDAAMHEWVGLLMYKLTGRSSEIFPGP